MAVHYSGLVNGEVIKHSSQGGAAWLVSIKATREGNALVTVHNPPLGISSWMVTCVRGNLNDVLDYAAA